MYMYGTGVGVEERDVDSEEGRGAEGGCGSKGERAGGVKVGESLEIGFAWQ